MTKEQFTELRAGLFTLITLAGFGVMIFILGTHKGYFEPQITLKAKFLNVYGLKAGAPVRFMGVGIGQVKDIILPTELPCPGIEVLLKINKSAQKAITRDSVATIKWLSYVTGDSYVEISSGACLEPVVEDGDLIRSVEPVDYTTAITGGMSTIESFSKILKKLEEGGFAESLSNVSATLSEGIKTFQKGEGLLYALMYDPKGKQLMGNLVKTTESLREITEKISSGEGTIGALVVDPTLYENLKKLLGGAERSRILRNLIRKSIEKGKEEK
jgi:phospholipid/cholesterol/gamma-HCH transport system substrate-binding protein